MSKPVVRSCRGRHRPSGWILLSTAVTVSAWLLAGRAPADDYTWLGSSGSWTDPNNWASPQHPMGGNYPQGSDNVSFSFPTGVTLDGGQAVNSADMNTSGLSFTGGSLSVGGTNLLRIGAGGFASVDLLGGGTFVSNGAIIGLGVTGTLTIDGGGTLSDSHEIDVGYANLGHLDIYDGGSASSSGPVFLGGFGSGNGQMIVYGQGASLKGNGPYIVVGNLGQGSMIIANGGSVKASADFIVAGFSSGSGDVTLNDSGSVLQVGNTMSIGSFGNGSLGVGSNASAMAKNILIGAGSTATGIVNVGGSGATLTASSGSLTVGNDGTGILNVNSGGQLNVQGGNSFVVIGGNGTGNGTVLVSGSGSQLNSSTGSLTVGQQGTAVLVVTDHGQINAQGLLVGNGSGPMASVAIDGTGSSIQANSTADIGIASKSSLSISNGGQLTSQIGSVGLVSGGNGVVNVDGHGSIWQVGDALNIGGDGQGGVLITNGGMISAPIVRLGALDNGDGTLAIEGANSKVQGDIVFGPLGQGSFHLRHAATYTFSQDAELVSAKGASMSVEDAGSMVQCATLKLGAPTGPQGRAVLEVSAGGAAAISGDVLIINGELNVGQGGVVTVGGGIGGGVATGSYAQVTVQGTGAQLVAGLMALGLQGTAALNIDSGGSVYTQRLGVFADGSAGASGSITVGANSSLGVGSDLTFVGPKSLQLTIQQGGYVVVGSYVNLGNASLSLSGGALDVGTFFSPAQANFVRVAPGGEFHSAQAISNLHNFGGIVQAGSSPGTMTISGDYIQDAGSLLRFSIDGTTPGTGYSQLIVNGNLQLTGKLRFVFEDGFTPQPGDTFDVIKTGGAAQLSNYQIEIQNLAPGFQYSFAPVSGGYRLTALSSAAFDQKFKLGDFSGDGSVTPADVPVMLSALTDLNGYEAAHHMAFADLLAVGDFNSSGEVDNRDIQGLLDFIATHGGGAVDAVPEPASIVLLALAMPTLAFIVRCKRTAGGMSL